MNYGWHIHLITDAWLAYSEQCPGWRTLRRQPRNSDLVLGISFQWSDKDSSLCWLSYLNKSLMSASGRAFRVNDILVMLTAFTLADSSFLATFIRPTGDLLLKVCQPTLGMTTAMGLKPFSISVLNKFYQLSLVSDRGFPQTAISRPMTSHASHIAIRSGPVFLKWLITVPSSTILRKALWSLRNLFSVFSLAGEDSGWFMLYNLIEPEMRTFSNSSIAQIPEPNPTLLAGPLAPLSYLETWYYVAASVKCHDGEYCQHILQQTYLP